MKRYKTIIVVFALVALAIGCKSLPKPFSSLNDYNFKVDPFIQTSDTGADLIYQFDIRGEDILYRHFVEYTTRNDSLFFYFLGVVSFPETHDTVIVPIDYPKLQTYLERNQVFWLNRDQTLKKLQIY